MGFQGGRLPIAIFSRANPSRFTGFVSPRFSAWPVNHVAFFSLDGFSSKLDRKRFAFHQAKSI
jgi:hypothetical protein